MELSKSIVSSPSHWNLSSTFLWSENVEICTIVNSMAVVKEPLGFDTKFQVISWETYKKGEEIDMLLVKKKMGKGDGYSLNGRFLIDQCLDWEYWLYFDQLLTHSSDHLWCFFYAGFQSGSAHQVCSLSWPVQLLSNQAILHLQYSHYFAECPSIKSLCYITSKCSLCSSLYWV